MRAALLILGASVTIVLAGCSAGPGAVSEEGGPLRVTTTTTMLTDLVTEVGGDDVEVTGLMGPGVDPHLYEASQGDIGALTEADVIVYQGLFLEGAMEDVLERTAHSTPTVRVTDALAEEDLLASQDYGDQFDPHVWHDPVLWEQVVEPVVEQLSGLRPESAAEFEANGTAYRQQIADAHADAVQRLAAVPEDQRVLVTGHDAFRYLGLRYGFEVRGLQGISTEAEAGAGDVSELAGFLVDNEVPAVFTESSVPRANLEAVRAACRAQGWDLALPEGELFSDAMGDAGTPEGTYPGMIRANADLIAGALTSGGA